MRKVIGIILILAICLITLTGCTNVETTETVDRFIKIYREGDLDIYYDKETKVQYMLVNNGYGAAMTVLIDSDGKPLLYQGE